MPVFWNESQSSAVRIFITTLGIVDFGVDADLVDADALDDNDNDDDDATGWKQVDVVDAEIVDADTGDGDDGIDKVDILNDDEAFLVRYTNAVARAEQYEADEPRPAPKGSSDVT